MRMTTYWVDQYLAIKARLHEVLEQLNDSEGDPLFKAVYFGKKAEPKEFPACVYWALTVRPTVTTTQSSRYPIRFRVAVISQDQHPDTGHIDAVTRLGVIGKAIVDDRQFGHLVHTSEIDEIDPEVERRQVRTRHEAAVILRFENYMLPM